MIQIHATGSIAQMISGVRGINTQAMPYAASAALTKIAQRAAKDDLPNEMRRVFDRPTPYALNSLFVQASTVSTLSARVMVKNTAARGVVPENFLQPEVEGGGRREKGLENALRYMGILRGGERVVPAQEIALDVFGNVPGSRVRSILNQLKTQNLKGSVFSGEMGRKKTRGIWMRSGKGAGRKITPLFIFTTKQPKYRSRLNFTGVVEKTAQRHFAEEFSVAMDKIMKKGAA